MRLELLVVEPRCALGDQQNGFLADLDRQRLGDLPGLDPMRGGGEIDGGRADRKFDNFDVGALARKNCLTLSRLMRCPSR